jgi:HEAT repeat protein
MAKNKKEAVPFSQVIDALLNEKKPFPPVYLHRFSDLMGSDLADFKNIWGKLKTERRLGLLEDLEQLSESDTVVLFDEVAKNALVDKDAQVRATALRLLWECEDAKLIPTYLSMLEKDEEPFVRASAATALGLFVYKGELEEIPAVIAKKIEDRLLAVEAGPDLPLVRRRALESLGYSSREEVPGLLKAAYDSEDGEWQASALFAMGRSADSRWEKAVLDRLDAAETEVQLEAVRAAGQLELESAQHLLVEMLENGEELDGEIRMAAAWSLSQIGGNNARDVLENLIETTEDEDEAEYYDLALENLVFTEEAPGFGMLNLNADNIEEHTQVVDLTPTGEDDENEEDPMEFGSQPGEEK